MNESQRLEAESSDPVCQCCGYVMTDSDVKEGYYSESYAGDICIGCHEKLPWQSNCCGRTPNGIEFDMELCGDCHEHCEFIK